jgi:hypothetical protein
MDTGVLAPGFVTLFGFMNCSKQCAHPFKGGIGKKMLPGHR